MNAPGVPLFHFRRGNAVWLARRHRPAVPGQRQRRGIRMGTDGSGRVSARPMSARRCSASPRHRASHRNLQRPGGDGSPLHRRRDGAAHRPRQRPAVRHRAPAAAASTPATTRSRGTTAMTGAKAFNSPWLQLRGDRGQHRRQAPPGTRRQCSSSAWAASTHDKPRDRNHYCDRLARAGPCYATSITSAQRDGRAIGSPPSPPGLRPHFHQQRRRHRPRLGRTTIRAGRRGALKLATCTATSPCWA